MIVDDHQLFRAGVRAELDGLVDVLGDAATVEDAVRLVSRPSPTSSCSTSRCPAAAASR